MDQTVTLVLRLVHIVAGVFWAGAVFLMVGFVFPAVRHAGHQGGRLMQQLQRRRMPVFMNASAGLTMLSGLILYGRAIAMTDGAWAHTRAAMAFGIGGLATIIAAIIGGAVVGRSGERLAKLGENVQASSPWRSRRWRRRGTSELLDIRLLELQRQTTTQLRTTHGRDAAHHDGQPEKRAMPLRSGIECSALRRR